MQRSGAPAQPRVEPQLLSELRLLLVWRILSARAAQALTLRKCGLEPDGVRAIGDKLPNSTLAILDLADNDAEPGAEPQV